MRKLLRHPLAKPIARGALTVAVFAMWAEGGLQWFLPRYSDWAVHHLQGLPWLLALPMAACLGVLAALGILATIALPFEALRFAEYVQRRFTNGRSDA